MAYRVWLRNACLGVALAALVSCGGSPIRFEVPNSSAGHAVDHSSSAYVPPAPPTRRPSVRTRDATPAEKAAFGEIFAASMRGRESGVDSSRRSTEADFNLPAECVVFPFHCAFGLVIGAPLMAGAMIGLAKIEETAAMTRIESFWKTTPWGALIADATTELQDVSIPNDPELIIEYRIVSIGLTPWETSASISGNCLAMAVEMALLERTRTRWRDAFVIGAAKSSPDGLAAKCWEIGAYLPSTAESLKSAATEMAAEIAKAMRRRTPGLGWKSDTAPDELPFSR